MARRNLTRTIYGIAAQAAAFRNLPLEVLSNSTLNEALLNPLIVPYPPAIGTRGMYISADYDYQTDRVSAEYLVIGNRGHSVVTGTGGPATLGLAKHSSLDAGMYGLIPFLVRAIGEDLSVSEQANYRLRKTIEIDGALYVAYFARKLPNSGVSPELVLREYAQGELIETTPFTPSEANLRPNHPTVGTINASGGVYASATAPLVIAFTLADVNNIVAACELLYGNAALAIISEIAICTGLDKPVTQRYPNSGAQTPIAVPPGTLYEAKAVQIALHATQLVPVNFLGTGFNLTFDLGAIEPLFGITPA